MPVRKLKVTFDLDVDVFAQMLAAGHSNMNIEAYEPAVEPRVTHTDPAQITMEVRGGMRPTILTFLTSGKKSTQEIKVIIVRAGYSEKSLPNALFLMREDGLIRSMGVGFYALTKKGFEHAR